MSGKVIAAGLCSCLQLMVGKCPSESLPGCLQCVVEPVFGIIHAVDPMDFTQAVFVEPRIVGYQRQTFYQWFYAAPYVRKYRSILGIVATQSVDLAAEPSVVVRFRTDQAVKPVGDFASADYYDSDRADACRTFVGRFEIYCSEIFHPVYNISSTNLCCSAYSTCHPS